MCLGADSGTKHADQIDSRIQTKLIHKSVLFADLERKGRLNTVIKNIWGDYE
jgi:hypothetical protein